MIILYKAILQLLHPVGLEKIDQGIIVIAITALINYVTGFFCLRTE